MDFLPVKKTLNSLVKVTLTGNQTEMPGLITRDSEGNLQVITGFYIFNWFFESGKPIVIFNKAGRAFPVKGIKRIAPLHNLIALSVEGDLTEQGRFPPIQPVRSFNKSESFFYTVPSSNSWFQTKRIQKVLSFPRRLDFLSEDLLTPFSQPTGGSFIINQKGEVVSFAAKGSSDIILFGLPLSIFRSFLSAPTNNEPITYLWSSDYLKLFFLNFPETYSHFLKGCLVKARQELYNQAQKGDSHDRYQLMLFMNGHFTLFKHFMRSLEVKDPSRIKEEWEFFLKSSAVWDPTYYLHQLGKDKIPEKEVSGKQISNPAPPQTNNNLLSFPLKDKISAKKNSDPAPPQTDNKLLFFSLSDDKADPKNTESKEYLTSLTQESYVRDLALQGHPHFQYLMGLMIDETWDQISALNWWLTQTNNEYPPHLFVQGRLEIASSIRVLLNLAEKNDFAPAQKMLRLLSQNLNEAESFLEQYTKNHLPYHLLKYFEAPLQWWQKIFSKDFSTEKAIKGPYENNDIFIKSLIFLTRGLNQLRDLKRQGYEPARKILNNFEEQLRFQVPFYPLSEEFNRKCSSAFDPYFTPTKKRK